MIVGYFGYMDGNRARASKIHACQDNYTTLCGKKPKGAFQYVAHTEVGSEYINCKDCQRKVEENEHRA